MNKKILSLILTLVMIMASFSMAFAAVPLDVIGTPVEEAVERLGDLGVLTGYPDGTFRPNENISRAEYAAVATRAKGLGQLATTKKGPTNFGDVLAGDWSSGYINVAEQEGLIKGVGVINGVNSFRPSSNIKYEQAVTIIVRALGYEQAAEDKGGYPTGHLLVAAEEGLLQGVSGSMGMLASRGLVAQMTYNALEVPMMIVVGENHIKSGTQGTDAVYLFNDLHLINQAAASGDWTNVDEDTFADAGITGVTASNLANIKIELQSLAGGDNQNWSPEDIQGVFDTLNSAKIEYINEDAIAKVTLPMGEDLADYAVLVTGDDGGTAVTDQVSTINADGSMAFVLTNNSAYTLKLVKISAPGTIIDQISFITNYPVQNITTLEVTDAAVVTELDNTLQTIEVEYGTKVSELKASIETTSLGATFKVLSSSPGGYEVAGTVNAMAPMVVEVTAKDSTVANYAISAKTGAVNTLTVTDANVASLAGAVLTVDQGTRAGELLAAVTPDDNKATVKALSKAVGGVELAATDVLTDNVTPSPSDVNIIRVTSQDGTDNDYTITITPVTLSSDTNLKSTDLNKTTVNNTLKTITVVDTTNVKTAADVKAFIETIDANATVKVLGGTGGLEVVDTFNIVLGTTVVEVTAEDGITIVEYVIN